MDTPYRPKEPDKYEYTVMFPKVLYMDISQTEEDLNEVVSKLQKMCELMQGNISTSTMHEYIFEHYGGCTATILAGPDSAERYRDNFIKRLAENFYNLKWILLRTDPKDNAVLRERLKEFTIYEDTYLRIRDLYPRIVPLYLERIYETLKDWLNTEANISQIASTDRESGLGGS